MIKETLKELLAINQEEEDPVTTLLRERRSNWKARCRTCRVYININKYVYFKKYRQPCDFFFAL